METEAPAAALHGQIKTLAAYFDRQPDYVVRAVDSGICAAKWQFPAHRVRASCTVEHILHYHLAGGASVRKAVNGRTVDGRATPGSIFLIPRDEHAEWLITEPVAVLQIYLSPAMLQQFAEENDGPCHAPSPAPVFGTDDPWLRGLFQMLMSEAEIYGKSSSAIDSLLLTQAQQCLIQHLARWYWHLGTPTAKRPDTRVNALRPFLLKRVMEYIETELASDIQLRDLAQLVCLSENHFIRAFQAATGSTPYQFVLERRLQTCAQLLRTDERSVAEIATAVGFKSPSYFSLKFRTRYGMTPTDYRRSHNSAAKAAEQSGKKPAPIARRGHSIPT